MRTLGPMFFAHGVLELTFKPSKQSFYKPPVVPIHSIDKKFPWRDGSQTVSCVVAVGPMRNSVLRFNIFHATRFRWNQLYAYYKYLHKLAREVAKLKLPDVENVRLVFTTTAVRNFN